MYITAGITEGEVYTLSEVEISGDTVLPVEDLESRLFIREGQTFSRALLELSSDSIVATLSNIGYACAQVNPVPEVSSEDGTGKINRQVVAGPRGNGGAEEGGGGRGVGG